MGGRLRSCAHFWSARGLTARVPQTSYFMYERGVRRSLPYSAARKHDNIRTFINGEKRKAR